MNIIYNQADLQIVIKRTQQQTIQLLDKNNKQLQSNVINEYESVFEMFVNLEAGTYKLVQPGKTTTINLKQQIFAYSTIDGDIFTFSFGDPFQILYANNQITGPVDLSQQKEVSVKYNPLLPSIQINKEPDLYFLVIDQAFNPIYTLTETKQKFTHYQQSNQNIQDYHNNNFYYQIFQNHQFNFDDFEEIHSIQKLQIDKCLKLGHRGCGSNKNYQELSEQFLQNRQNIYKNQIAENTIHSYNLAYQQVDGVELDIILTSDAVPVISHDFGIDSEYGKLAINSLTQQQFKQIQIQRVHQFELRKEQRYHELEFHKCLTLDHNEYPIVATDRIRPTFEEVLKQVNPQCLINIEIKYPAACCKNVGQIYFSRATVIHQILQLLNTYPERKCYFSSFDPGVVFLLRMCQNKYPVFFLNMGKGQDYDEEDVDFKQQYVKHIEKGAEFALRVGLQDCVSKGLQMFTWGTLVGDQKWEDFQINAGIKGLIYDLVLLMNTNK